MRSETRTGAVAVVVIPQAHLIIHAYPDYGYAAVDMLFADQDFDSEACQSYLEEFFSPAAVVRRELFRGGEHQSQAYRQ